MNNCFRIKSPSFLALGAWLSLFYSFVGAREQHHTLQKVTTTEQQFSSSAPLSWQSEEVRDSTSSRTVISNRQLKKTGNLNIENALQNVPG
ncbi:hypothetical protein MPG59_07685, partial [Helicobacter pylori]|nr:hypothetical protein [Helicobacter pylori]